MWLIYAFLAAIFAALVAILGKIGLEKVDPIFATSLRAFLMFVIVFLVTFIGKKINFASLDKTSLWYIFLSALAGALSWIFFFLALKLGDPSKISAIDRLSIVFVVLLSFAFALEQFSWLKILGALLMALGAIIISL